MSFVRRQPAAQKTVNVNTSTNGADVGIPSKGYQPSAASSVFITSTGIPSLDALFPDGGIPSRSVIMLQEQGMTEYSSVILRTVIAQGLANDHKIIMIGGDERWRHMLPAIAKNKYEEAAKISGDEMKIAWRYARNAAIDSNSKMDASVKKPVEYGTFCHNFDLSARMTVPSKSDMQFVPINFSIENPFSAITRHLHEEVQQQSTQSPLKPLRIVIPSFLNPMLYKMSLLKPKYILQFIHSLKAIIKTSKRDIILFLSLSTSFYEQSNPLLKYPSMLMDGVLEIVPFLNPISASGGSEESDKFQGLIKIHKMFVEEHTSFKAAFEDWAFKISRKRGFQIDKWSLPPLADDEPRDKKDSSKASPSDIEF